MMASRRPTFTDYPPSSDEDAAQAMYLLAVIAVLMVVLTGLTALMVSG